MAAQHDLAATAEVMVAGKKAGLDLARLMARDVRLYLDLAGGLGVVTLTGPGTLTAFEVSSALGYGDLISNRVVDALGDLAGGIRVADQSEQEER